MTRRGIITFSAGLAAGIALGIGILGTPAPTSAASAVMGACEMGQDVESRKWKNPRGAEAAQACLQRRGDEAGGPGGANLVGNHRSARFERLVYAVPESYGDLVTASGNSLWYRDREGVLRNVVLKDDGIYRIDRVK